MPTLNPPTILPAANRRRYTIGQMALILRGKAGRFLEGHFRKRYVAKRVAERQGDCGRCGACCYLLFKCPFAKQEGSMMVCSIYESRPVNCRIFPYKPSHLAERDAVMPEHPCGFHFDSPAGEKKERQSA